MEHIVYTEIFNALIGMSLYVPIQTTFLGGVHGTLVMQFILKEP